MAEQTIRKAWKYALVPTLIILFLAVYPQLNIWMVKGASWNGAYVVSNYDETAYSAYVNSLIAGKSRRNDPFVGKDNLPYESLYSIQVVPAYSIAIPARIFGFSASTAFIILNFLIPIFASLTIFALIRDVTKDDLLAAVGVVTILCLGAAIVFQGELRRMLVGNAAVDFFPYLRRYQPGFAFPIFFLFCLFVWRALTADKRKSGLIQAAFAGLTLALLVFSYFYLWTAAAAWFACLTILWLVFRKDDARSAISRVGVVAAFGVLSIIPYFILLSNRTQNTDDIQLLTYTRMPNPFEIPEIIGILLAAGIIFLTRNGKLSLDAPAVLFTLSLAIAPVVVFNQQVITGRSLQPVHYTIFVANYMVLTAAVLFVFLARKLKGADASAARYRKALIYFAVVICVWGVIESSVAATRNAAYDSLRVGAMPALAYLRDRQSTAERESEAPTVISTNLMVADYVATVTSYRPLWNPHTNSAGGVDQAENKELFYRYLYYSGFDEKELARALDERLYEVVAALFGGGRALPELASGSMPITAGEKEAEIRKYKEFISKFDAAKASAPVISYIIVPAEAEPSFSNLDRWYRRDEGRTFGLFRLYGLTPKTALQLDAAPAAQR